MKILFLVAILLVYFPVLYYFKKRIIHTMGGEDVPVHLRWYEGAGYLIKHSADLSKRQELTGLQTQIRIAGMAGIVLFWIVALSL
jgi:hypothetical protein